MRALILFVIGLAFGGAGGFLAAGGMGASTHDHAGHADAGHTHTDLTGWDGPAPVLALAVKSDTGGAVNLHIAVTGFTFDPAGVNGAAVPGTGHAHVYVNGEKVARAYGPDLHLPDVHPGALIRVTLNANDHSLWGLDGQPIAAEITFDGATGTGQDG